MTKGLLALVAVMGMGFGQSVVGAPTKEDECDACGKPTAWDEFNALDFKMTSPRGSGYAAWRMQFDNDAADIQVVAEFNDGKKSTRGRILLVGGRVMATQGPITEPGVELDALDAPILERHLVTQLLGRSQPGGPPSVHGVRSIDFTDDKTGIKFATPGAQGYIPAPWHVQGDVKTIAADVVQFTLALTVDRKGVPAGQENALDVTFTGRLSKTAGAKIDDAMSLDGWKILALGVQTRKEGNGTAIDYGAAPVSPGYKTVADIRKQIAAEDLAGEPAPSKDPAEF